MKNKKFSEPTFTLELSESDIKLIVLSLKKSAEWLQSQKGELGGVLMGFSKIDSICKDMQTLTKRLTSQEPNEANQGDE